MHNVFATDNQVDVHVDIFPVLGIQGAGVTISSLSIFPPICGAFVTHNEVDIHAEKE